MRHTQRRLAVQPRFRNLLGGIDPTAPVSTEPDLFELRMASLDDALATAGGLTDEGAADLLGDIRPRSRGRVDPPRRLTSPGRRAVVAIATPVAAPATTVAGVPTAVGPLVTTVVVISTTGATNRRGRRHR